jgi:hypothetical protein
VIRKYLLLNGLRFSSIHGRLWLVGSLVICVTTIPPTTAIAFGESASAGEASAAPAGRNVVALEGSVRGEKGEPLVGALVSIFGAKLGSAGLIAFTDEKGRFLIAGLEPGYYTVRAYLSGFLPSHYSGVELDEVATPVSVQMVSFREKESPTLPLFEGAQETPLTPAPTEIVQDDDQAAEFEWLLRHVKKNILHEQAASLPTPPQEPEGLPMAERAVAFQPTGELGLFGFERGLHDIPTSPGELDAQLAYARLSIPTSEASEWMVSAQLLESALSSWAARAEFVSERSPGQQTSAGLSYGNYVYGDVNESTPRIGASSDSTPDRRTNEWFGTAYGGQSFQIGVANLGAGLTYHHYSYLDRKDYAAPRLDVAVVLDDASGTLLRGLFDYRVLAPGGEDLGLLARMVSADFMGSADLGPRDLTAETTIRYEMSVERPLGDRGAVEFRVFQENVSDPLLKAYLERPTGVVGDDAGPGQYLVMNQGDLRARGVGLVVNHEFGGVSGAVGYRFGLARALAEDVGAFEVGHSRGIHDLTTSVRTEIDPTRTRVLAVCRLSVHPSLAPGLMGVPGVPDLATTGVDPARTDLDTRFNVQVHQLLPFIGWNSTEWELVLAVRNLFYEDWEAVSLIDEMSVVDSPARVMGGVKVQF